MLNADVEFVLMIDGVPACPLASQARPVCSLRAWSQAMRMQLRLTSAGCWLGGRRLRTRIYRYRGEFYASVAALAAAAGLEPVIDPITHRVWLYRPDEASIPLPWEQSDSPSRRKRPVGRRRPVQRRRRPRRAGRQTLERPIRLPLLRAVF